MLQKTNNHVMLTNRSYNVGKKLVQIYIPAVSSLYFSLSGIWDLPATEKVVGTFAVIATFLGVCLGLSSKQYDASGAAYDGKLIVQETEEGKLISLEVDGDPEELVAEKDSLSFKVFGK